MTGCEVGVPLGLGDGLGEALGDGLGEALGDGLGEALGEGLGEALGDGLGLGDGFGEGLGLGLGLGEGLGDGLGLADGLGLGDGLESPIGAFCCAELVEAATLPNTSAVTPRMANAATRMREPISWNEIGRLAGKRSWWQVGFISFLQFVAFVVRSHTSGKHRFANYER